MENARDRRCTWVDPSTPLGIERRCDQPAHWQQPSQDGEVWADLCDKHADELNDSIESHNAEPDVKLILRNWVRAGGGAKKMAGRM